MKNQKEIEYDLKEKRKEYLKVLAFVFDKSFPIVFDQERIERAIQDAIRKNENQVDLVVSPFEVTGLYCLNLEDHVKDACCKKYLGFFPKQTEFPNIDLNELESALGHFNIYDYNNLVVDILKQSAVFRIFKEEYLSSGYNIEIIEHSPAHPDCTIRITWANKC